MNLFVGVVAWVESPRQVDGLFKSVLSEAFHG